MTMADSGTKYLDLSFIERDIRNQLAHSKDILSLVERLRDLSFSVKDESAKAQINDLARRFLAIATDLSSNALTTSSKTGILVGPMVPKNDER
jgi:hypothetical protein